MNDTLEKTTSSLAIVEKKPHRPGGCVGIFFQLFDWNRRFAKKKLFSKKLLPPVRLKQASKKFGGDEKQPKLRLIADENSGGFPTAKNTNVDVDEKKEVRSPGLVARLMGLESMPALHRDKSKKVPSSSSVSRKPVDNHLTREELNVEKGGIVKHELRPQKLQKTSVCSSQSITRFSSEKLPFKNVLSKSRKHQHPKLPYPVKSPRNLPKKSSSKLIGAANRILEPGLQTSRLKSALTYSTNSRHPPGNAVMEEMMHSCRNCGYTLDNLDSEQPSVFASPSSHCVGSSCQGQSGFDRELKDEFHEDYRAYKNPFNGQTQVHPGSQQCKNQSQNQMWRARNTFPPRSKSNNGVTSNKVPGISSTRSQVPVRIDNGKFEQERRIVNRMNESMPPGRKRRPVNISRQGESSGNSSRVMSEKRLGYNVHFINRQERTVIDSDQVDNNVVSFTFNSRVKHKTGSHEAAERRVQNNSQCSVSLQKPALGENSRSTKFEKSAPISGDALGALLEQKLKELNGQGEDLAPKKTTATILHELISALTSEIPFQAQQDNHHSHSQANTMTMKLCVDQPLDSEQHLSPGSVLEAYFSSESCPSSSLDDNLGYKLPTEFRDCSYHGPWLPNPETEILDSINTANRNKESVFDILNNVLEVLRSSNLADCGLKGNNLEQTKETLLNAELVLHNAGSVSGRNFPIKHLLLDELETLGSVLWMNFGCSIGVEEGIEVNQLTRFAFDSIIEYLDLRFGTYPTKAGSKVSRKLPLRVNANTLIFEIVDVVRKWDELSRLSLDDLIELEMSLSLGEWTECESEGFESGMEISRYIFQILVDEIVVDLLFV